MRNADLIRIVETGYQLHLPRETWLEQTTCAVAQLVDAELGTIGYFFDATDRARAPQASPVVVASDLAHIQELPKTSPLQAMIDAYPLAVAHTCHPRGVLASTFTGLVRERGIARRDVAAWQMAADQAGFTDSFGVICGNTDGHGAVFSTQLTHDDPELSASTLRTWTRLAVHLAAGERLHRRLGAGAGPDDAAAVLDAVDGELLHAGDEARDEVVDVREAFVRATRAIDRARGRLRRDEPLEALALWRGLVDGRWSLVEHVEHDGKRLLLAHRNEPQVTDPRRLTRREKQVVDCAVLGHDNNLIAYQLGLSAPTVANHLSRALTRLGIASRTELIALYQQLVHAPQP